MEDVPTKRLCIRQTDLEPVPSAARTSQIETIEAACSLASQENGTADVISEEKNIIVINAINMLMESSSSESDDEEELVIRSKLSCRNDIYPDEILFMYHRVSRNSVKNYVEKTVPTYSENEFRRNFRISRSLFENLCGRLLLWDSYSKLRPDKRLGENVYMLVFLWFAGHEACSFRDLSDRFDLSTSTICKIIELVSMFLSSLSPEVIKWPTETQKIATSQFFDQKCGFSKAIGCIDGTHITIDPPSNGKDEYIDRKGNTTLTMQAICDANKKFINVFVGYPGSSHDSWVLKNSPIYNKLPAYCGDYYILGDSAYPCNKYLVTPYRDNGHLTRPQKLFNMKLSSGRVAIEHVFGMLKQRFRQLYYCKLRGNKKLCHFTRACCVLHNLANEDDLQFTQDTTPTVCDEFLGHNEVSRGNVVRDPICQSIQLLRNENVP